MATPPLTFRAVGSLPCSWEDFFSNHPDYPHVTITTRAEADNEGFDYPPPGTIEDGWLDIIVDIDAIDADVARLVIADAFGVANPEDIVIVEARFAQSV